MEPQYGILIRDARLARGLSQAELADLVGVMPNQVSRWERGVPPTLGNAVELSKALDVSLDELAGLVPLGLDLSGVWYAAWQTWRGGVAVTDTHTLISKHHGERVTFKATGDYEWFGEFQLSWHLLKGGYRATDPSGPATGTLTLAVTPVHDLAFGYWSGITGEGRMGSGWGVLSRDQQRGADLLQQLINDPASVTEWPIELAGAKDARI